jgi:hypothetical protein
MFDPLQGYVMTRPRLSLPKTAEPMNRCTEDVLINLFWPCSHYRPCINWDEIEGWGRSPTQGWGRHAAMGDRWIGRWGALCQMGLRPTKWSRTSVASYHMMFSSYSINSCHLLCLNRFCIALLFFNLFKSHFVSVSYMCVGVENTLEFVESLELI